MVFSMTLSTVNTQNGRKGQIREEMKLRCHIGNFWKKKSRKEEVTFKRATEFSRDENFSPHIAKCRPHVCAMTCWVQGT